MAINLYIGTNVLVYERWLGMKISYNAFAIPYSHYICMKARIKNYLVLHVSSLKHPKQNLQLIQKKIQKPFGIIFSETPRHNYIYNFQWIFLYAVPEKKMSAGNRLEIYLNFGGSGFKIF